LGNVKSDYDWRFSVTGELIMKKWNLAIAAAVFGLAAATSSANAADKLKVGFIYVGPIGDHGWSYQHNRARLEMQKALGEKVETTYLENVPESADAERVLERLVRSGHKLIFATSFGYMDSVIKVAKKYPDVRFEHAVGFKRAKNVSTYMVRMHEADFLMGRAAAKMTKTGTLGFVATFPVPVMIAGINAYMKGAQSVNPNIKMKIVWTNSWFNPTLEADAAKTVIQQGADVLRTYADSPSVVAVAHENGAYAFALGSNMIKFGPKAQLTADVLHWGGYYTKRVKEVLAGTWSSTDTWGGLKSKMFAMASYTNMPVNVKKFAMESEASLRSGKLVAFKCPVFAQDGKAVECKGGDRLGPGQIRGMNWFIKGIEAKMPGK
jgi:simple sugar transport system substrate-binding protein